jgi:hypothetical protein
MNERIDKLFEQALEEFKAENKYATLIVPTPLKEKFAELIVKECRDIVEQDMKLAHIQMIPLTLEKYANGRLKEKIREHFGVEE